MRIPRIDKEVCNVSVRYTPIGDIEDAVSWVFETKRRRYMIGTYPSSPHYTLSLITRGAAHSRKTAIQAFKKDFL